MSQSYSKLKIADHLIKSGNYLEAGDNLFEYLSRLSPDNNALIDIWNQSYEANKIRNKKIKTIHNLIAKKLTEFHNFPSSNKYVKDLIENNINRIINIGTHLKKHNENIDTQFSKSQLIKRWIELQNRCLLPTFYKNMHYTDELIDIIDNYLSDNERQFACWLLMDFYPNYINGEYDDISICELYEQQYCIFSYVVTDYSPLEYFGKSDDYIKDLITYPREEKPLKYNLKNIGVYESLQKLIFQAEHFKAFNEFAILMRGVFSKESETLLAIQQYHDGHAINILEKIIECLFNDGLLLSQRFRIKLFSTGNPN